MSKSPDLTIYAPMTDAEDYAEVFLRSAAQHGGSHLSRIVGTLFEILIYKPVHNAFIVKAIVGIDEDPDCRTCLPWQVI